VVDCAHALFAGPCEFLVRWAVAYAAARMERAATPVAAGPAKWPPMALSGGIATLAIASTSAMLDSAIARPLCIAAVAVFLEPLRSSLYAA
jgi:hypothetical protein